MEFPVPELLHKVRTSDISAATLRKRLETHVEQVRMYELLSCSPYTLRASVAVRQVEEPRLACVELASLQPSTAVLAGLLTSQLSINAHCWLVPVQANYMNAFESMTAQGPMNKQRLDFYIRYAVLGGCFDRLLGREYLTSSLVNGRWRVETRFKT